MDLVGVQELPARQRTPAGDVLDATAIWNQTLLGQHVVEVAGVELGEAVLLGNVDLEATTCRFSGTFRRAAGRMPVERRRCLSGPFKRSAPRSRGHTQPESRCVQPLHTRTARQQNGSA